MSLPHGEKREHDPANCHSLPALLPPEAIAEFQELWEKNFGRKLSRSQAQLKAQQTFNVLRLLWEPLPKKRTNEVSNNQTERHSLL